MRLTLRGFQSHEETVLDVQDGLVCVTGPNNVGKSAIVRAVRWLMYDALRGSRFFKKGFQQASVRMEFDDDWAERFKEKKSGGRNGYQLGSMKDSLEAIGKGAPPEAEKVLGIRPIQVDKDLEIEANVVQQKDHPFLMDVPGSAKAKVLNALTGQHFLDVALRNTAAVARALKSDEKELSERKDALGTELGAFADLLGKELAVAAARRLNETMLAQAERSRRMGDDLRSLEQSRTALRTLLEQPAPDMASLEVLSARMDSLVASAKAMRSSLNDLETAHMGFAAQSKPVPDVDGLDAMCASVDALVAKRDALKALQEAESKMVKEELAIDSLDIQMDAALSSLKALAGTACGECGRLLDEASLEASCS